VNEKDSYDGLAFESTGVKQVAKRNVRTRIAKLRAQIAARVRYGQDVDDLRAELRVEVLTDDIQHALNGAPPLTSEQRAHLAAMLAPATDDQRGEDGTPPVTLNDVVSALTELADQWTQNVSDLRAHLPSGLAGFQATGEIFQMERCANQVRAVLATVGDQTKR
jgi:hypothetical protein